MTDQGFLARWSRRKRQARRRRPGAPDTNGVPPVDSLISAPAAEERAAETAAVPAKLPRIEDLTAETDLAQFLRKGVPLALRNAALRHVWALDPKIRDHVGDALDYAYDWNAAGGVPGAGPLADNEIEGLLRRVVGEDDENKSTTEPPPETTETAERIAHAAPIRPLGEPESGEVAAAMPEATPVRRRHGGALPN
jgi:hypothetical protein